MSIRPPCKLTSRPSWIALEEHCASIREQHLRSLFCAEPQRGSQYTVEAAGLYLDYSKNRIDRQTVPLLARLASDCQLRERTDAMFRGDLVNCTERRPALHTALRTPLGHRIVVDGVDVVPDVHAVLGRMAIFSDQVRRGGWTGHTGRPIRNVINIGIGGSDLGPAMAHEALRHYSERALSIRFVSNVDGTDLVEALREIDAVETLFIICSKSFNTSETLANARSARAWIVQQLGDEAAVARHFVAVSVNAGAVTEFGIAMPQMFPLWDWVGGRNSIASAIGLSVMVAIGSPNFLQMLAGMRAMDVHFRSAPIEQNMPALLGMLAIWNTNFLGSAAQAVLPYEQYLRRFPAYLQQLTMESNGKNVTTEGLPVGVATSPIIWGEPGTNGQHSFFQLLHQGTHLVPCDFIGFAQGLNSLGHSSGQADGQHDFLIANMFLQAEAMAFGRTLEELRFEGLNDCAAAHRVLEGNRSSNTLLGNVLTPHSLGVLIALFEHSVFTQVVWDIDSFDQWGVELGKELAQGLFLELRSPSDRDAVHDSSTQALIQRYRSLRRTCAEAAIDSGPS
ncbi:glucose-6-phosphate isomerase [Acidovorax sp. A1169]|uniref:glucose-6-phosphate isomerase n=1 Tax=Acidovorax sp. A1169 TaxID=3059524 RepID=UPI002737830D|nr:glucose-6-phosphate isomerase [Acidovorax sp. A1169]MDP4076374.1 glucose-6-phosphate isomerase [Acidovorax sp. A1169]